MSRSTRTALAVLLVLVLAGAAWFAWQHRSQPVALAPVPAPAPAPVAVAPQPAPPAASEPTHYPIEAVAQEAAAQGPLTPQDLQPALIELFGRKAVLGLLQLDDFPRRVAATVDNLARTQSASRLWPVKPVQDRFLVREERGVTVIDPDNAQRYTPLVLMAENVNLQKLAAFYRRLYPLLQSAYEELGFPGKAFNDRAVQVIDHLLATPEPTGPLEVKLPTFSGPVQPTRPWVLYQFVKPEYESLSSGQKILLRVGPVNERRLKARLAALRKLLVAHGSEQAQ